MLPLTLIYGSITIYGFPDAIYQVSILFSLMPMAFPILPSAPLSIPLALLPPLIVSVYFFTTTFSISVIAKSIYLGVILVWVREFDTFSPPALRDCLCAEFVDTAKRELVGRWFLALIWPG